MLVRPHWWVDSQKIGFNNFSPHNMQLQRYHANFFQTMSNFLQTMSTQLLILVLHSSFCFQGSMIIHKSCRNLTFFHKATQICWAWREDTLISLSTEQRVIQDWFVKGQPWIAEACPFYHQLFSCISSCSAILKAPQKNATDLSLSAGIANCRHQFQGIWLRRSWDCTKSLERLLCLSQSFSHTLHTKMSVS